MEGQGRFGVTKNRVPLGQMKVTATRRLKVDQAVTVNATKLKKCPKNTEVMEEQGRYGVTENRVPLGQMKVTATRRLRVDHAVTFNTTKLKICPKTQK